MAALTGSRVSRRILANLVVDKSWILPGKNILIKYILKTFRL